MSISKQSGGLEDLLFGLGSVTQLRKGQPLTITEINSSHIPYTLSVSVAQELTRQDSVDTSIRASIDNHRDNMSNPHSVTFEQLGASPLVHRHVISDIDLLKTELDDKAPLVHTHEINDIIGLETELNSKAYTGDIFLKTDHIVVSNGGEDAGKPLLLDSNGKLHPSVVSSGPYPVGSFTPTNGDEYPDTSTESVGAYWIIKDVDEVLGYTYLTGDLIGETVFNGNDIVYGATEWSIISIDLDVSDLYKLDGSQAITHPFSGGGQPFKNAAPATEAGDLIEYNQVIPLLATFVKLDGTTPMEQSFPMGNHRITGLLAGSANTDAVTVAQLGAFTPDWTAIQNIPNNVTNAITDVELQIGLTPKADKTYVDNENNTQDTAIALNTAKVGITTQQAGEISVNTTKVGITTQQADAIVANTAKTGVTTEIKPSSYATNTIGGTIKIRVDGTTAYITTDGTNA